MTTTNNDELCGLELSPEQRMNKLIESTSISLWQSYTDKKQECEKYKEALQLISHTRYINLDSILFDDIYRIANNALKDNQ